VKENLKKDFCQAPVSKKSDLTALLNLQNRA